MSSKFEAKLTERQRFLVTYYLSGARPKRWLSLLSSLTWPGVTIILLFAAWREQEFYLSGLASFVALARLGYLIYAEQSWSDEMADLIRKYDAELKSLDSQNEK